MQFHSLFITVLDWETFSDHLIWQTLNQLPAAVFIVWSVYSNCWKGFFINKCVLWFAKRIKISFSALLLLHHVEPWQYLWWSISARGWITARGFVWWRWRWGRRRRRRQTSAQGSLCHHQDGFTGHSSDPGTRTGIGSQRANVRVRVTFV